MSKVITHEDYVKLCKSKGFAPLDIYSKGDVLTKHKCGTCKFVWSTKPNNVRNSSTGCPKCAFPYLHATLEEWRTKYCPPNLRLLQVRVSTRPDYCKVECRSCGHKWEKFRKILMKNPGCPKCVSVVTGKTLTVTLKDYRKRLAALYPHVECLAKARDWKGVVPRYDFRCTKHNLTYSRSANTVSKAKGTGCCKCERTYYKVYKLRRQRVNVMGFEPQALDWIKENKPDWYATIQPYSSGKVPLIDIGRGARRYMPDLYVESQNRIVEVKSLWTLARSKAILKHNIRKIDECKAQGYKFNLLVMDERGNRITLPKNWRAMTPRQLQQYRAPQ